MENINTLNRTFRIALSLGLVVVALNMTGPLGDVAYALFVSIYAGITGFIGWDPVIAFLSKFSWKPVVKQAHTPNRLVTH